MGVFCRLNRGPLRITRFVPLTDNVWGQGMFREIYPRVACFVRERPRPLKKRRGKASSNFSM